VEYFVVFVRDRASLATLFPALGQVVASSAIRILDIVAVTVGSDGVVEVIEADASGGFADLGVAGTFGSLLSLHDIELVSLALKPGTAAIVVLAEDRWAAPLSAAARAAGGEVLAGERIVRQRIEAALAMNMDQ
jgi:hypothetical protein